MIFTMASVAENMAKAASTSSAPRPFDGTSGTPSPSPAGMSTDIEAAEAFLDAGLGVFQADRQDPVDHRGGDQHLDMAELGLALGAGEIHDFPDADDGDERGILQHRDELVAGRRNDHPHGL